jgi:hypothetical protein
MAASSVYSETPNCLTLSTALFSPYHCKPMLQKIKRMAQINLEVRPSTLQESSDIVTLAGHLRLQYRPFGENITQPLFFGYANGI